MIKATKKIIWNINSWLNKVRAGSIVFGIVKRSKEWPFDPLIEFIRVGGLAKKSKQLEEVKDISRELFNALAGQQLRTSFRHEIIDMDGGQCARGVSSPSLGGALIYNTIKLFKPKRLIELGSAFGVGTFHIAAAMNDNGGGEVVGIEFEAWRADVANKILSTNWPDAGKIYIGRIEEVIPTISISSPNSRFDFAFVDAVHK